MFQKKKKRKNIDEEIHSTCSSAVASGSRSTPIEPRCFERMWVFTKGVAVHPTSVFRDVCGPALYRMGRFPGCDVHFAPYKAFDISSSTSLSDL